MAEAETQGDGVHASWGVRGVGEFSSWNGAVAMVSALITQQWYDISDLQHVRKYPQTSLCMPKDFFKGFPGSAECTLGFVRSCMP